MFTSQAQIKCTLLKHLIHINVTFLTVKLKILYKGYYIRTKLIVQF
jgi:hypothetical protein